MFSARNILNFSSKLSINLINRTATKLVPPAVMPKRPRFPGRTTDFKGNTLWEIVGELKDYGVGRLVIRSMFQRYPEACYYRILHVEPVEPEEDEVRKVRVKVEKTWRGVTLPKPITIYSTSYKKDYQLVPIEEEEKYLKNDKKVEMQILPTMMEMPPLLRDMVRRETGEENPMIKVHFRPRMNTFTRLAVGDEKPTVELTMGLGTPASPSLYEGALNVQPEEDKSSDKDVDKDK